MRFRSPAAAALAISFATPATAEIKTLAQVSGWKVKGGLNGDGIAVCSISATMGDSKFSLVLLKGSTVLHVQLFGASWLGQMGGKIPIEMRFDDKQVWKADAVVFKDNTDIVFDFYIDADAIDDWMEGFNRGGKLILGHANDRIDEWHADLAGTKVIGEVMKDCVEAHTRSNGWPLILSPHPSPPDISPSVTPHLCRRAYRAWPSARRVDDTHL